MDPNCNTTLLSWGVWGLFKRADSLFEVTDRYFVMADLVLEMADYYLTMADQVLEMADLLSLSYLLH